MSIAVPQVHPAIRGTIVIQTIPLGTTQEVTVLPTAVVADHEVVDIVLEVDQDPIVIVQDQDQVVVRDQVDTVQVHHLVAQDQGHRPADPLPHQDRVADN